MKDGSKSWFVIFTCASFRCEHWELVNSLSTGAFLLALQKFICRRGRPVTVYSDNGTNFHGADNLFKSLDWQLINEYAGVRRIQWRFNPPSAAWWGGWWERLIRSTKDLLRKMLGHRKLSEIPHVHVSVSKQSKLLLYSVVVKMLVECIFQFQTNFKTFVQLTQNN
jgi:hypothetical protein